MWRNLRAGRSRHNKQSRVESTRKSKLVRAKLRKQKSVTTSVTTKCDTIDPTQPQPSKEVSLLTEEAQDFQNVEEGKQRAKKKTVMIREDPIYHTYSTVMDAGVVANENALPNEHTFADEEEPCPLKQLAYEMRLKRFAADTGDSTTNVSVSPAKDEEPCPLKQVLDEMRNKRSSPDDTHKPLPPTKLTSEARDSTVEARDSKVEARDSTAATRTESRYDLELSTTPQKEATAKTHERAIWERLYGELDAIDSGEVPEAPTGTRFEQAIWARLNDELEAIDSGKVASVPNSSKETWSGFAISSESWSTARKTSTSKDDPTYAVDRVALSTKAAKDDQICAVDRVPLATKEDHLAEKVGVMKDEESYHIRSRSSDENSEDECSVWTEAGESVLPLGCALCFV